MCETMQSSHRLRPAMALVCVSLAPTASGHGAGARFFPHCRLRRTFPDHVRQDLKNLQKKIVHFYTFLGDPQVEDTSHGGVGWELRRL